MPITAIGGGRRVSTGPGARVGIKARGAGVTTTAGSTRATGAGPGSLVAAGAVPTLIIAASRGPSVAMICAVSALTVLKSNTLVLVSVVPSVALIASTVRTPSSESRPYSANDASGWICASSIISASASRSSTT